MTETGTATGGTFSETVTGTDSYFYGDSQSDIPLMEAVTNPVAVGDDPTLCRVARERSWPIISLR